VTAELNIYLEDPVYTTITGQELHKTDTHSRVAIVKPLNTVNSSKTLKP
jgi:hypothetical protein